MSFTVLLDLDNTLITNDMGSFLPAYFKTLSSYLPEWPAEKVIQTLMAGTNKMVTKKVPNKTLEQEFDSIFYPGLGVDKIELQKRIDKFYQEGFPTLQGFTSTRPEALSLVDFLFNKGYPVVIATNPLFPLTAIEQRLEWAGLPVNQFSFALVTSFETFHFCKPNPAYLAEILAQLGWPDQPAVVIGDGLDEEIIPAGKLGIPAFWITDKSTSMPAGLHPMSEKGTLGDVIPWLQRLEAVGNFESQIFTPESILAVLNSTPAAFDTFTKKISGIEWHQRLTDTDWAANEIICHLRDVDQEVNLPRMKSVASGENPFFAGIVTDVWAEERKYIQEDGITALNAFTEVRSQLVKLLADLDEKSWELPARHAIFGPTKLIELAVFISTHDRTHVHQMFQLVNKHIFSINGGM